jgi:alkylation response protein AidB-like acyl-CoA dehydrogenase
VTTYRFPLSDWLFVLKDLLRLDDRGDLLGRADLTSGDLRDLLVEGARLHEEVLAPLNVAGDREGARFVDGRVRTPAGFVKAWDLYRHGGWHVLNVPSHIGGGGLPSVVTLALGELRSATAHSFAMYGAFCGVAGTMIAALGEDWMRAHVVPRLIDGDWTATMCMTESHAGSDLRELRTRAEQQADGTWRLRGAKIFISGGDHDLTENIVHIVLAKVVGEDGKVPEGLAGVGVFLVPARTLDPATGALGGVNGVHVDSIEDKMGIEASATCALRFEDAVGWRIVDRAKTGVAGSMGPMFFLMNKARLGTALSGVAYAEMSYQYASAYAHERLSGRAPGEVRRPDLHADPLVAHPDVRRLLLSTRAFAEGGRALAARVALWQLEADLAGSQPAADLVKLLAPVLKAYFTDKGMQSAIDCQQVLGGHGYTRDHPIEQWVRNARIGQIYEGANGIQARDLVRNRLVSQGRRTTDALFDGIEAFVAAAPSEVAELAPLLDPISRATAELREAVAVVSQADEVDASGVAYDLLTALGTLAVAWTWAECVLAAATTDDERFLAMKAALARIWIERELPLVTALCERMRYGGSALTEPLDEWI